MNAARTVPWSCQAVRTWRSVVSEPTAAAGLRNAQRGLVARHIAGCADCRRYFASIAALESSLRSTAPARTTPSSDDLHARIMRAVAHAGPETPARRRIRAPLLIGLGAAAALVAITAILPTRDTAPPRPVPAPALITAEHVPSVPLAPSSATAAARPTLPFTSATVDAMAERLDRFAPVAAALAQDPLQSEVDSVYADARYAVRFLALNFLPADALADNRSGARGPAFREGGG